MLAQPARLIDLRERVDRHFDRLWCWGIQGARHRVCRPIVPAPILDDLLTLVSRGFRPSLPTCIVAKGCGHHNHT